MTTEAEIDDVTQTVDHYLKYFEDKLLRLESYEIESQDEALKKSVIVSMLDAMSRTVSNENAGNRERFTGLIANFCDWKDSSKISATHLRYLLKKLRSPEYAKARVLADQVIAQYSTGEIMGLDHDPELSEVKKIWPVSVGQKVLGHLSLESITHLNLFYSNRNSLVHEHREPGQGFDLIDSKDHPYYIGLLSDDKHSLELLYPEQFHFKMAKTAIQNLRPYLIEQRLNPFECYRFGSSYIEELNE